MDMLRREYANAKPDDSLIPWLIRDVKGLKAFLKQKRAKSNVQIEADRTIQDSAEGAVAGRDADDDEEINSGPVASKGGNSKRARD